MFESAKILMVFIGVQGVTMDDDPNGNEGGEGGGAWKEEEVGRGKWW